MNKKLRIPRKPLSIALGIALILLAGAAVSVYGSWSEPVASPPNGTLDAALNEGSLYQARGAFGVRDIWIEDMQKWITKLWHARPLFGPSLASVPQSIDGAMWVAGYNGSFPVPPSPPAFPEPGLYNWTIENTRSLDASDFNYLFPAPGVFSQPPDFPYFKVKGLALTVRCHAAYLLVDIDASTAPFPPNPSSAAEILANPALANRIACAAGPHESDMQTLMLPIPEPASTANTWAIRYRFLPMEPPVLTGGGPSNPTGSPVDQFRMDMFVRGIYYDLGETD
jgi:hypothetical protein